MKRKNNFHKLRQGLRSHILSYLNNQDLKMLKSLKNKKIYQFLTSNLLTIKKNIITTYFNNIDYSNEVINIVGLENFYELLFKPVLQIIPIFAYKTTGGYYQQYDSGKNYH